MSDLFWPGDDLAGDVLSDASWLADMIRVEREWLGVLIDFGLAPGAAADDLVGACTAADIEHISRAAAATGNPASPLVELLRERLSSRNPEAAAWLHRGLTSQDVIDTALALGLVNAVDRVEHEVSSQVATLLDLTERHRRSRSVARTLTQHAVPTTFGMTTAAWLAGIVRASRLLRQARAGLAVQVGGAAGTLAATTEIAAGRGRSDPPAVSMEIAAALADRLGLGAGAPWHTTRGPFTAVVDAFVGCTDAWGHVANDVATLSRPEVGELSEAAAGRSSTMPQKRNPVLSVLLRRTAISNPALAATLHLASASAVDQRPDGAWHAEWPALRTVARRSVTAAIQASQLMTGLGIDTAAMAARLELVSDDVGAEQRQMAHLAHSSPSPDYLGAVDQIIDAVMADGRAYLEESS